LNLLSFIGAIMFLLTLGLMLVQVALKLLFPSVTPKSLTTVLLSILFFGAINLFAIGVIGEYVGRIFEEVKRRPLFIRRSIIRDGDIRTASVENPQREE
jgi:dolichol-phosphate mannosyltransferase